ncbi:hypothetical protein BD413DRAFT_482853 [Trametes elegans]|nr:hypothetical protein BD413DRAFT_482853 [Trametes elegans]
MSSISQSRILLGFTTSNAPAAPALTKVPLSDKALGVHRVTAATTHNLVRPPVPLNGDDTQLAWEAIYPEGSINPGNKTTPPGGFGFYLRGPPAFARALQDHNSYTEVVMGYDLLFQEHFEFRLGGKLPGVYGGAGDSAYGCTGGRQTDRCKCFNLRLMWRENGVGELYGYVPPTETNKERLLTVPPRSIQHPDYGFSIGRGAWTFKPGCWIRIVEWIKMNDLGAANGEIEVRIDGKSVIHATGLVLRTHDGPDARVQGLHFQTFFGGNSPEWASPKNQRAWFANVFGAILKPDAAAPDGHDEL